MQHTPERKIRPQSRAPHVKLAEKKKEKKTYLGTWASEGQQNRQKHQAIYCSNNNQCSQEMKKVPIGRNEAVFLTKLEFLRKFKASKTRKSSYFYEDRQNKVKDCGIESLATRFAPNVKNIRRDERVPMSRRF